MTGVGAASTPPTASGSTPATPPRAAGRVRTRPARRRRHSPGWVPQQHGAWAMVAVPFVVGVVRGGPAWTHVALGGCWLVGYFAFNAAGLWLRSRRHRRYLTPLCTYGAIAGLSGIAVLALQPSLAWWLPVFAPLAGISLAYSHARRDRALANDVVTIVAACLVALVAHAAGSRPGDVAATAWVTGALATYFVGTSLYVKTLIRERRSRGYKWASILYHALATAFWGLAPLLGAPVPPLAHGLLVAFFAVTTSRAALLAGRPIRPRDAGFGEIAASAAILCVVTLAW